MECRKCGHVWEYTGNQPFYVTCPQCRTQNRTNKPLGPVKYDKDGRVIGVDYNNDVKSQSV